MIKNISKILFIFILGILGGVWAQISLLPFLADCPFFQNFQFVKDFKEKEVVINPKTEIIVRENVALQDAISKVEKAVVGVKTKTLEGEILVGSGLIVTSDGLMVTLVDLVPRGSDFYFFVDGKWPAYQILKRDLENNLALVKTEDGRLPTTGFADLERIRLGERVFLVGMDFNGVATSTATGTDVSLKNFLTPPKRIVNDGIVAAINDDFIQTNIFEEENIQGSPLFDIGGNVVGLNMIDEEGKVVAIPVSKIRQLIGF